MLCKSSLMDSGKKMANDFGEDGLISIIVPVYNCLDYVGRCIDSILVQTYSRFELIIVFNELSEESCGICEQYAAKDERIRLFRIVCKGVSGARNFGLEKANGEYVAFIDSDDRIEPDYLEKLLNAIHRSNFEISMCNYAVISGNEKTVCDCLSRFGDKVPYNRLLKDSLYCRSGFYCWGMLWRREAIVQGFRYFRFSEDAMFVFMNLAGRTGYIAVVNEPLYQYVRHDGSITARKDAREFFDALRVAKGIVRMSENVCRQHLKPSYSFLINTAFFAYLSDKTGDDRFAEKYDDLCVKLIKKYRTKVILDLGSTMKTKCACLLSLVSMRLVRFVYSRMK